MEKRGKKKKMRGKYNKGEQYAPSEPCDSKKEAASGVD